MATILVRQACSVHASGELVRAEFANVWFNLGHELALAIASDLRAVAKAVKKHAGDESRAWNVQGVLTDANVKTPDTFVDGDAVKQGDYDIGIAWPYVSMRISTTTIKMTYQDALKIAGWFRVAGKQAGRNAGDLRHWSIAANTDRSLELASDLITR